MKRSRAVWNAIPCCPPYFPERTSRGPMDSQKLSRILAAWTLSWAMLVPPAGAQQLPDVEKPHGIFLYRPYLPNYVAPITLHNSSRIRSLLRSGNLYLTVQDAIALAIENNLNLEIARYTLPSADWNV